MQSQFTYADAASITVAIVAVAIAVWSGYLTRCHNRLSVVPKLKLTHRFRGAADSYGVRLINGGLGPAILKSASLYFNSSPVESSHQGWIRALHAAGLDPNEWTMTRFLEETILRAGEEVWIFRSERLPDDPNRIVRCFSRFELVVDYQSLYEEKQPQLRASLAGEDLLVEDRGRRDDATGAETK